MFFTPDGLATKIFIRRKDASEEHIKKVFESEVNAYNIDRKHEELQKLIPYFYGQVNCSKITDHNGTDISKQFHLNYAYQMEKVEGNFVKIGGCKTEQAKRTINLFQSAGIFHTSDISVVADNDDNIVCIIDFALEEFELEHSHL